eukprot:564498-Rhodomonas_salina.1
MLDSELKNVRGKSELERRQEEEALKRATTACRQSERHGAVLKQALELQEVEMGGLEFKIGDLRAQLEVAAKETVELRKAKEEKEQQNVQLEKKLQGQGVELIEARQKGLSQQARMQSSLDKLSTQLTTVRSDLVKNQNEHRRSRAELEDKERLEIELKRNQQKLQIRNEKLREELTDKEKEVKVRADEQAALEKAYDAHKDKLAQAQQAEATTRKTMQGLQAELAK